MAARCGCRDAIMCNGAAPILKPSPKRINLHKNAIELTEGPNYAFKVPQKQITGGTARPRRAPRTGDDTQFATCHEYFMPDQQAHTRGTSLTFRADPCPRRRAPLLGIL
ncbi:hypothetical protein NDU88_001103 [Pleurodeles waltl]|uniref:Uncharacterized protein n=1 Tax=Pleurodeles waltl TaxID=8319 RepID=A0AAV7R627_PLEWA|nr:hypothetical protein NDU88_001103 [Pleurodeles waltl]